MSRKRALWFLIAASSFFLAALANLSLSMLREAGLNAYDRGEFGRSADLLLIPGSLGNASAQAFLGSMYVMGQGVERDGAKAEYWLTRAAENDLVQAQTMLGALYATGSGIPRNIEKAKFWLIKAANGGDASAAILLKNLGSQSSGV